jgi:FlaA1/EpsC-like NDP-sugar epimerase
MLDVTRDAARDSDPPRRAPTSELQDRTLRRRRRRDVACFLIDTAVLAAAFVAAFLVRYDADVPPRMVATMLWSLPVAVALQYALMVALRVPRFSWAFVDIQDIPPIVGSLTAAAAALLALRYGCEPLLGRVPLLERWMIPASVVVLDAALAVLGIAGVRAARRLQRQWLRASRRPSRAAEPTVLIGAGVGGRMLLQELRDFGGLGYAPVAFVDDDLEKVGRLVAGILVEGTTHQLAAVAARHDAKVALIAIATADSGTVRRIVERCKAAGLRTKIVPQLQDLVSGRVRISQLRDVAIEDLLGRAPVAIEASSAPAAIGSKVVVVTGAGGSIGSELCRQIARLHPARIVLVERFEGNLYEIHRELVGCGAVDLTVPELADVGDAERMAAVFEQHRPQVVFHAAAHKHVPMMERVPGEAIKNNVFGTKTVADLSDRHGVERFVLLSTDKAVRPSSVMGATKRIAELYVKDLNARSRTRFVAVRFGNVMGSAGSVIPLFTEQIQRGGPLTVTHPDMERFFMTIPEACRLVLEAAGLCRGGEVMLLDMGTPVNIRQLAENMVRLSGLEPYRDIDIVFTGIRPGEKLHEELALPEEQVELTACKQLFVWRGGAPSLPMDRLLEMLRAPGHTADTIVATLRQALPEFRRLEPAMQPVVLPTLRGAGRLAARPS